MCNRTFYWNFDFPCFCFGNNLYKRENNKLITWQVMVTGPTFKSWVTIIIAAALLTAELIANDELLRTLIAYGKRVVGNGLRGRWSLTKWKRLWSNERRGNLHRILNSFIGDSFFMTTFKGTGQRHSIFCSLPTLQWRIQLRPNQIVFSDAHLYIFTKVWTAISLIDCPSTLCFQWIKRPKWCNL